MEKCISCDTELVENAQYCHVCGRITKEFNPKTLLGVEIGDDDILDYITEGRLKKAIQIGKNVKVVLQTLTSGEVREINAVTDSLTEAMSTEKTHSIDLEIRELSYCIVSLNGVEFPEDRDKRYKMTKNMGTALHKILFEKARLLHEVVGFILQEGQVLNF